jgi:pectin methylesterase-like acyl-CoA thioesterase
LLQVTTAMMNVAKEAIATFVHLLPAGSFGSRFDTIKYTVHAASNAVTKNVKYIAMRARICPTFAAPLYNVEAPP